MKIKSKIVGALLIGSLVLTGCQSQINTGENSSNNLSENKSTL